MIRSGASNILLVAAFAFALRAMVSLHSYSGQNKPPMYGDYEAQRHWQEICINLPIKQWYRNSSDNDLLYWGLDYPPLTAYHSYLAGQAALAWNTSFVELHKSRGISTEEHKNFMRITVLCSDLFLYIPSMLTCTAAVRGIIKNQPLWEVFMISVIYPGQILIDNGHFQYNNMSLGLTLLAVSAIFRNCNILATILFSLALNYKQMELYHALPFFLYLLRQCFAKRDFRDGAFRLVVTGLFVVATFLLLWFPWALTSYEDLLAVVRRIFPFDRGIFEDKVSNLWCTLNVFIKLKILFKNETMALISLGTTLLSLLPSCIHLFLFPKKTNFLYSLINCSLGFFLFSFQKVTDESDGCGGKFSCVIVSPEFEGKKLLQRHRLVNSAIAEELKTIHAFSQKTFTPSEWKDKEDKTN